MSLFEALYNIAFYVILLPLIPLCFYPVLDYVKSKMSILLGKIVLSLLTVFIFLLLFHLTIGYININLLLCFISIYFLYLYHKEVDLPIFKKLFIFMTAALSCAFSLLFATIFDYFLYPNSNYLNFSLEALGIQLLFLISLDILLFYPFRKYLSWIISNFHNRKIWRVLWVLPLIFIPILGVMIPQDYRNVYSGRTEYLYPTIMACVFVMVVTIYVLFYRIIYSVVKTHELEQQNKILDIQSLQYHQLLRSVQENSRIRHDFKHQLIVISELLKNKEYEPLEQYIQGYVAEVKTSIHIYSYSPAANVVLSYYESLCQSKEITPHFSFHVPDQLPISDQDFCVMLGNLLENAMYACEKVENPYIQLKVGHTAVNILALKITNPYVGELKKKDGIYQSSRHKEPAQGLESVKSIVEKYHGVMEILAEDQVFTVKILLQFSEKPS